MVDKQSVLNGGTIAFTSTVINGRQSFGMPVNYDAASPAQYMVWADEFTTSTSLRIYAITDPLTTPAVQFTTVTVPSYSHPADPPQMGTSVRPELFEARFWSAVVRDGQLWATHHQGSTRATVRWYQFDLEGWPTSGNPPTLVQSGDVDLGAGIWTFFGSIWVDAQQNMALTFARSATNEFISMQMAHRLAGDPLGTTQPPVQVRPSTGPETSGRWGDYSKTNDDPVAPGSFWGSHEYQEGGWRTRIARIDLCTGGVTSYCVTSPNSVGSGAVMSTSGTTSIVVKSDVFGQATFAVDYGNLPAGGSIFAGSTWNFQHWYRDPGFGSFGFNFSDAVEATFCD